MPRRPIASGPGRSPYGGPPDSRFDWVIRTRRAVTPEGVAPAAVALRDGRIAAVADYAARLPARRETDLGSTALLPGLVDCDVAVHAPGQPLREGYAATASAALRGGVTSIAVAPGGPGPRGTATEITGEAALKEHLAAAAPAPVGFVHLGAVTGAGGPADLAELRSAGAAGFHCSLSDGGAGSASPIGDAALRKAMVEAAAMGAPILVHAEDPAELSVPDGPGNARLLASRPPRAERRGLERVIAAARVAGTRTHVTPFTAAECAALLDAARAIGVALSAHTCPHYLCLPAEQVPDDAPAFRCRPPLRSGANREALWSALLSGDGAIRTIGSGHRPGTGVSSLPWTLPALWTAARRRGIGLDRIAEWTSAAPARLLGLKGKGVIAPGADADLAAFDPDAPDPVPGSDPGPYAGRTLTGRTLTTWVAGRAAYTRRP